jgi:predicted lysophospholipase L1 biosynthesis ABC-type transport system permease subunit
VRGRTFTAEELRGESGAVLLGEHAAAKLFPGSDPIGRGFMLYDEHFRVVGVVRDIAVVGLADPDARPIAYFPLDDIGSSTTVIVRTQRRDAALFAQMDGIARQTERDALIDIARGEDLLGDTLARQRFTALLLTVFAGLAAVLSAVGLYGVLAQVVAGRTHEIGVRVALGATAAQVRTLVLNTGGRVVALGLAAGFALAFGSMRVFGARLFGLEQSRPSAYLFAILLLAAVSLCAMWRPAARAARIDPMRALLGD